jgi:hypothetical protein
MTVKYEQVSAEELDATLDVRRGRVSYPIIKGFMETGYYVSKIILDDNRKPGTMYMLLKSYVDNHDLPIKVYLRKGRLYLMRLDIDVEGNKVENWKEKHFPKDDPAIEEGAPIEDAIDDI